MKKILLIPLLLTFCYAFAQNWQTVNSSRIAYFEFDAPLWDNPDKRLYEELNIAAVDTLNGDSIFKNFQAFYGMYDFYNPDCDILDTSWIGYQVVVKENGDNLFYTISGDSLRIKTRAMLNDYWYFGKQQYAELTQESVETIHDNIQDSVKTITLTNGMKIKFSKNYGLIETVRFSTFPDDTETVVLKGIEDRFGVQNLKYKDVFDFDVGDEFHYYSKVWAILSDDEYSIHSAIRNVISKEFDADSNSNTYIFEYCSYTNNHFGEMRESGFDTITISLDSGIMYSSFERIANPSSGGMASLSFDSTFNARYKLTENLSFYSPASDSCYYPPCQDCYGTFHHYAVGLGRTNSLVYFRKANGEQWGTPIGGCESLGLTAENVAPLVQVYPNPSNERLQVSVNGNAPIRVQLYDLSGQLMYSEFIRKSSQINTANWANGSYVFVVENEGGMMIETKKVVIRH